MEVAVEDRQAIKLLKMDLIDVANPSPRAAAKGVKLF
jgi:hypothetical protein